MSKSSIHVYVLLVASLNLIATPVDAKMYRWVDQNGQVYYSDQVPPQKSSLERKELNKQGIVINTIKAAKTPEQIALEKRLELLRKEQENIIAKQKAKDKVLLSTFRNIDDLRMTLDGKLAALDAQKRVHDNTMETLKENLLGAQQKAALAERKGQKVPDKVLTEIATIEQQMVAVNADIASVQEKHKDTQIHFAKEIERFLLLTKHDSSAEQLSDVSAELAAAEALGLYNCLNATNCAQAWGIAKQFVRQYSTTAITFDTENLMMGADPITATDLSLSVSKNKRANDKVSIFLDIRCHNSTLGDELCQSDRVKQLRHTFKSYIEHALP